MCSASGSTRPFIACWEESFAIEFGSMPTVTAVKRWKAWTKSCDPVQHRGSHKPLLTPREITLEEAGGGSPASPEDYRRQASRKGPKDSRR